MLIIRNGKIYEDDEPLQEQLPLQVAEVQEEFSLEIEDTNPVLTDKLKALNERKAWKSITVE